MHEETSKISNSQTYFCSSIVYRVLHGKRNALTVSYIQSMLLSPCTTLNKNNTVYLEYKPALAKQIALLSLSAMHYQSKNRTLGDTTTHESASIKTFRRSCNLSRSFDWYHIETFEILIHSPFQFNYYSSNFPRTRNIWQI